MFVQFEEVEEDTNPAHMPYDRHVRQAAHLPQVSFKELKLLLRRGQRFGSFHTKQATFRKKSAQHARGRRNVLVTIVEAVIGCTEITLAVTSPVLKNEETRHQMISRITSCRARPKGRHRSS